MITVKWICQYCDGIIPIGPNDRVNRPKKYCNQKCAKSDPEHNKRRGLAISKTKMGVTYTDQNGIEGAEARKAKLRAKSIGENNPFYGHKHSDATIKLMSKNRTGKRVGYKYSGEAREKMRQAKLGTKLSEATKRKISKTKTGVSIKRTKVQRHYQTSKLEETFQARHPEAIPKHPEYHYEWDFKWGKWLVEIDGDYWHGLDRDEGYTKNQKHSMANDKRKNQAVIRNAGNLMRFRGSRGDDLDEEAYVVIEDGVIR